MGAIEGHPDTSVFQRPKKLSPLRIMQYLIFGSAILYFGSELFIPLSFALLISFILYPVCSWMERKHVGRMTAIIISVSVLTILVLSIILLMMRQVLDFLTEWPVLQTKIIQTWNSISSFISKTYGITHEQQVSWLSSMGDQTASSIFSFLTNTLSVSALSAVMVILIPIYSILILYYRHLWLQVVYRLFPGIEKERITEILSLTIDAYYNFIKGMGIVYLVVGILNSVGLLILGVPHAIFFGVIASILTFIPYVGIIVGSLLPITMAWVTYDSVWYPVGIVAVFTFVQYLEANVIFPLAVSNRLNMNTLAVLISIFLGGLLWGVAGMILFVPFAGIIKLIADHHPHWKTLSMLLGTESIPDKVTVETDPE